MKKKPARKKKQEAYSNYDLCQARLFLNQWGYPKFIGKDYSADEWKREVDALKRIYDGELSWEHPVYVIHPNRICHFIGDMECTRPETFPIFWSDANDLGLGNTLYLSLDLSFPKALLMKKVKHFIKQYEPYVNKRKQQPHLPEFDPWEIYFLKYERGLSLPQIARIKRGPAKEGEKNNTKESPRLKLIHKQVENAHDRALKIIKYVKSLK